MRGHWEQIGKKTSHFALLNINVNLKNQNMSCQQAHQHSDFNWFSKFLFNLI
jgi:hypothetical protein